MTTTVRPAAGLHLAYSVPNEQETLVTLTLKAEAGKTRLRRVHERLPAATFEAHRDGWMELFGKLDDLLG